MSWLTVAPDVLCQEVEGEMILLNLPAESYHSLNTTGRRFLAIACESDSFDSAVQAISAEFSIQAELAGSDLARILEMMHRRNLVVVSDPSLEFINGSNSD